MEKLFPFGLSLLLATSLFPQFPLLTNAYSRPSARNLVFTNHHRSESDPQQVHVSMAGKDHVRVTWVTEAKHFVKSEVEYGKERGKYNSVAIGNHTSYHYFFYSSGKIHHVKIGPLDPSTTYYYRCGGYGPEFSFRTPPPSFPIEFAVVGDLGQTEWTKSTLKHVGNKDYDIFLLPGDLSYADSQQPLWDSFGRLVEPYASQRPWMVTEGNHETRIYDNKADPCGPLYITIGDGGNREGLAMTFKNPAPPLSLFREPSFGHGRFRILDEKRAHWSWHRNNDSDSVEADQVWLDSLAASKACWGNELGGAGINDEL